MKIKSWQPREICICFIFYKPQILNVKFGMLIDYKHTYKLCMIIVVLSK